MISHFFKMSTREMFLLYCVGISLIPFSYTYCPERNSCAYNAGLKIPSCYCDVKCKKYRDCCKGYVTENAGETNILSHVRRSFNEIEPNNTTPFPANRTELDPNPESLTQIFRNQTSKTTDVSPADIQARPEHRGIFADGDSFLVDTSLMDESCISLTEQKSLPPLGERIGTYMIDTCDGPMSMCEARKDDILSLLPVSDGDVTYRNVYCASCNGIENTTGWTMNLIISMTAFARDYATEKAETDLIYKVLASSAPSLKYTLIPSGNTSPRYCFPELAGDKIYTSSLHQNVIVCNKSLYRNPDICLSDRCCADKETNPRCLELSFDGFLKKNKEDGPIGKCEPQKLNRIQISISLESDRALIALKQSQKGIIVEEFAGLKIRYKCSETNIFFEAVTDDNTPLPSIKRCVNDVLFLLYESMYGIYPTTSTFLSKLTRHSPSKGLKTFQVSTNVQNNADLKFEELEKVLKLKRFIRCNVEGSDTEVMINVTTKSLTELMKIFSFSKMNSPQEFNVDFSLRNISAKGPKDCHDNPLILQVSKDGESIDFKCDVENAQSLSSYATGKTKQGAVCWLILAQAVTLVWFGNV